MSKRDEIAEIIWTGFRDTVILQHHFDSIDISDKILSTLTRDFEVVEECDGGFTVKDDPFKEGYVKIHITCLKCNGSGTITRQATWEEVIEAARYAIELHTSEQVAEMKGLPLESGGRLRMKK